MQGPEQPPSSTREVQPCTSKAKEAIAGSRAVKASPMRYTMAELLAGAEASGIYL